MPAHQIWSCHVTQDAKFRIFIYFVLILHLILGKITRFLVEKLSTSEVISKNLTGGGVKNTPQVPLGLNLGPDGVTANIITSYIHEFSGLDMNLLKKKFRQAENLKG